MFSLSIKYIIASLTLFMGIYSLIKGIKENNVSILPKFIKKRLREDIKHTVSVSLAFMFGVIVSLLLLPCSAGPYLVALYYMRKGSFTVVLSLLLLYNLIFVLPLIFYIACVLYFIKENIYTKDETSKNSQNS